MPRRPGQARSRPGTSIEGSAADVRQQDAPLRDPQRGRDGDARPRMAADRVRAGRRVPARGVARGVPQGRAEGRGQQRQVRPGLHPRAGRQGAARVRHPGAQPGAVGPHRRRPHGLRVGLRAAVRPRGGRPARRDDGGLPQLREAVAGVPAARLAGRHDRRAERHAARLAPPRHGLRAPDPVRQAVHGLGDERPERRRHDRDERDPVRRPRVDREDDGVGVADQRQLAAALRRPHARGAARVRESATRP